MLHAIPKKCFMRLFKQNKKICSNLKGEKSLKKKQISSECCGLSDFLSSKLTELYAFVYNSCQIACNRCQCCTQSLTTMHTTVEIIFIILYTGKSSRVILMDSSKDSRQFFARHVLFSYLPLCFLHESSDFLWYKVGFRLSSSLRG